MLEAAIVLELVLGKYVEAAIIALLLVFNAALGLFQESRAQATLAALKSRLARTASVKRDGSWKTVPAAELAAELVPGDVLKLSLGGVVAADVKLTGGEVLLDHRNGCDRRHAAHLEGRLHRHHWPCPVVADCGRSRQGTRGQRLPRAGGRRRTFDGDEARGTHRAQRPSSH
jgi:E1-E2 ATPase